MTENTQQLTLDRIANYEIKVPGAIDKDWLDWNGGLTVNVESESVGSPISTLSILADQAALHGLLRHLYTLGLPLISVVLIDHGTTVNHEP